MELDGLVMVGIASGMIALGHYYEQKHPRAEVKPIVIEQRSSYGYITNGRDYAMIKNGEIVRGPN